MMHAEFPTHRCHAAIRREVAPGTPISVLHIGEEHTVLTTGAGDPVTHILAIGSRKAARDWLRHSPPTPLEMEQAIAAVEEEIMPLHAKVPRGSVLYTPDAAVTDMLALAGEPDAGLSIHGVERLFNRLAAVSAGTPASQERLPLDGGFYATVLILREFMHHLGFASVGPCAAI
jgi:hypothetical protein